MLGASLTSPARVVNSLSATLHYTQPLSSFEILFIKWIPLNVTQGQKLGTKAFFWERVSLVYLVMAGQLLYVQITVYSNKTQPPASATMLLVTVRWRPSLNSRYSTTAGFLPAKALVTRDNTYLFYFTCHLTPLSFQLDGNIFRIKDWM